MIHSSRIRFVVIITVSIATIFSTTCQGNDDEREHYCKDNNKTLDAYEAVFFYCAMSSMVSKLFDY